MPNFPIKIQVLYQAPFAFTGGGGNVPVVGAGVELFDLDPGLLGNDPQQTDSLLEGITNQDGLVTGQDGLVLRETTREWMDEPFDSLRLKVRITMPNRTAYEEPFFYIGPDPIYVFRPAGWNAPGAQPPQPIVLPLFDIAGVAPSEVTPESGMVVTGNQGSWQRVRLVLFGRGIHTADTVVVASVDLFGDEVENRVLGWRGWIEPFRADEYHVEVDLALPGPAPGSERSFKITLANSGTGQVDSISIARRGSKKLPPVAPTCSERATLKAYVACDPTGAGVGYPSMTLTLSEPASVRWELDRHTGHHCAGSPPVVTWWITESGGSRREFVATAQNSQLESDRSGAIKHSEGHDVLPAGTWAIVPDGWKKGYEYKVIICREPVPGRNPPPEGEKSKEPKTMKAGQKGTK